MPLLLPALHGVAEVVENDYGRFVEWRCGAAGEHGTDTGHVDAGRWGVAEHIVSDEVVGEEFPLRLLGGRPGVGEVGVGGESGGRVEVEAAG